MEHTTMNERQDDGSLAFLRIPRDENSRSFNCDETTQSKLVNTEFWVVDFIEEVPTKFSKQKGTRGQTLVKIKMRRDAPDSEAKKFFTGSQDILYILKKIKEREIFRLPYYPDRIVHHAVMNVLEPIWTKVFTYNTYSCIKGRGIEGCARRVGTLIKRYEGKPLYCLKIDIKKFYPSIDHGVLKSIVRRKLKDKDLLWLLDEIIDSAQGLPIGNYLSQFLANLCLAYFMHWVNEELPEMVRRELGLEQRPCLDSVEYADDIPFLSDRKDVLHVVRRLVDRYLTEELHLTMKGNWQIFPIARNRQDKSGRALDYVGYKFYREQKLIRKSIKQNFCRAAAKLNKSRRPVPVKAYKMAVASWLGWAQHSNSKHLLKSIINPQYYVSIL